MTDISKDTMYPSGITLVGHQLVLEHPRSADHTINTRFDSVKPDDVLFAQVSQVRGDQGWMLLFQYQLVVEGLELPTEHRVSGAFFASDMEGLEIRQMDVLATDVDSDGDADYVVGFITRDLSIGLALFQNDGSYTFEFSSLSPVSAVLANASSIFFRLREI